MERKILIVLVLGVLIAVGFLASRYPRGSQKPRSSETAAEDDLPRELAELPEDFYPAGLTREGLLSRLHEAVDKTGEIHDETWSGVIRITGDTYLREGASLTILPGTIIFLAAHSDDQHSGELCEVDPINPHEFFGADYRLSHTSLRMEGCLRAVGTPDEPIVITSDSAEPTLWDWDHLVIRNGTLRYCVVEYGWGIVASSSSVEISHCVIRKMLQQGVLVNGKPGVSVEISPNITYNFIYDVGHGPVQAFRSSPYIASNVFIQVRTTDQNLSSYLLKGENPGVDIGGDSAGRYLGGPARVENNYIMCAHNPKWTEGLRKAGGIGTGVSINSNAIVQNNIITGGDLAFELFGGAPRIHNNCVHDISEAYMWVHSEYRDLFPEIIDVSNNWWGTTDETTVSKGIKVVGDGEAPEIGFLPLASSPIPNAGPNWTEFEWLYK